MSGRTPRAPNLDITLFSTSSAGERGTYADIEQITHRDAPVTNLTGQLGGGDIELQPRGQEISD